LGGVGGDTVWLLDEATVGIGVLEALGGAD
jgi:hypothetical protein